MPSSKSIPNLWTMYKYNRIEAGFKYGAKRKMPAHLKGEWEQKRTPPCGKRPQHSSELDRNAVVFSCKFLIGLAENDDAADQVYNSRDRSPAEQYINDSETDLTHIEVADSDVTEKNVEQATCNLALLRKRITELVGRRIGGKGCILGLL